MSVSSEFTERRSAQFDKMLVEISNYYKKVEAPDKLIDLYNKEYKNINSQGKLTELEKKYNKNEEYKKLVTNFFNFYPYKDPKTQIQNRIQPVINSVSEYIEELKNVQHQRNKEEDYFISLYDMVTAFNGLRNALDKYSVEQSLDKAVDDDGLDINVFKEAISSYNDLFTSNLKSFENATKQIQGYEKKNGQELIYFSSIAESIKHMREEAFNNLISESIAKMNSKKDLNKAKKELIQELREKEDASIQEQYELNFETNKIEFGKKESNTELVKKIEGFGKTITEIIKSHEMHFSVEDKKIINALYAQLHEINEMDPARINQIDDAGRHVPDKITLFGAAIKSAYLKTKDDSICHRALGKILVTQNMDISKPHNEINLRETIKKRLSGTTKSVFGDKGLLERGRELTNKFKKSVVNSEELKAKRHSVVNDDKQNDKPEKILPKNLFVYFKRTESNKDKDKNDNIEVPRKRSSFKNR